MKKLLFLSIFISTVSFAQVTDENGNAAQGASGTALSGKIGIGMTPSATSPYQLEVNGAVNAKQGWFINTLPNGHVFPGSSWAVGTALIRAGVDKSGEGLFNFYDVPQSNLNAKPFIWFDIEDRDDKARLRLHAYEGGGTSFRIFGKDQNDILNIWDPGDQYAFVNFTKPDSYMVIGGENVWPVQHKLTVKDGSALIEGDLISNGKIGIGVTPSATSPYQLEVNGAGRFSNNLLIGDPNGARTEVNINTNHKIYAPTNFKTIDLDGNWHGGGFIGVYRADNGIKGVSMESKSDPGHYNNSISIQEFRLTDNTWVNAIKLSSTIFTGDTEPTNFIHMPRQKSTIVIGDWGNYKKGQGYGLINKLKTNFENDVYIESGNLGIGTNLPKGRSHIVGDVALGLDENNKKFILHPRANADGDFLQITSDKADGDWDWGNGIFLNRGGNVGIGTDTFADGSDIYRLSVNGKVRAHSVKVYTTWADHVFKKDYNLLPLDEVKTHIDEKGHLPNMPSAEEVEENGIELGEMNAKLLEKIEELTLYLLDQDKTIRAMQSEIEKLKKHQSEK